MRDTQLKGLSYLNKVDSKIEQWLGRNTLFYIGIVNTLVLVALGVIITYVAAVASEPAVAVLSAMLFAIAAVVCMYFFQRKYGPAYESGREDIITFVAMGSIGIAVIPMIITNVFKLTGLEAFRGFIGFLLLIMGVVLALTYLVVYRAGG